MKKTTPRLVICGTCIILLLALIWGNSCLNGQTSGEFSGWVGALLGRIFPFLSADSQYGHLILRKLAHFSEFAALGLCFGWFYGMVLERKAWMLLLPAVSGMAAAVIDETIQIFTPGRHSSIVDVGIDSCGVLAGLGALYLLCFIAQWFKMKKRS